MTRWLAICVLLAGCSEGTWWHPHARRAAQQLCQATDLHEILQTPTQKQLLAKFCESVGWPLDLNQIQAEPTQ